MPKDFKPQPRNCRLCGGAGACGYINICANQKIFTKSTKPATQMQKKSAHGKESTKSQTEHVTMLW